MEDQEQQSKLYKFQIQDQLSRLQGAVSWLLKPDDRLSNLNVHSDPPEPCKRNTGAIQKQPRKHLDKVKNSEYQQQFPEQHIQSSQRQKQDDEENVMSSRQQMKSRDENSEISSHQKHQHREKVTALYPGELTENPRHRIKSPEQFGENSNQWNFECPTQQVQHVRKTKENPGHRIKSPEQLVEYFRQQTQQNFESARLQQLSPGQDKENSRQKVKSPEQIVDYSHQQIKKNVEIPILQVQHLGCATESPSQQIKFPEKLNVLLPRLQVQHPGSVKENSSHRIKSPEQLVDYFRQQTQQTVELQRQQPGQTMENLTCTVKSPVQFSGYSCQPINQNVENFRLHEQCMGQTAESNRHKLKSSQQIASCSHQQTQPNIVWPSFQLHKPDSPRQHNKSREQFSINSCQHVQQNPESPRLQQLDPGQITESLKHQITSPDEILDYSHQEKQQNVQTSRIQSHYPGQETGIPRHEVKHPEQFISLSPNQKNHHRQQEEHAALTVKSPKYETKFPHQFAHYSHQNEQLTVESYKLHMQQLGPTPEISRNQIKPPEQFEQFSDQQLQQNVESQWPQVQYASNTSHELQSVQDVEGFLCNIAHDSISSEKCESICKRQRDLLKPTPNVLTNQKSRHTHCIQDAEEQMADSESCMSSTPQTQQSDCNEKESNTPKEDNTINDVEAGLQLNRYPGWFVEDSTGEQRIFVNYIEEPVCLLEESVYKGMDVEQQLTHSSVKVIHACSSAVAYNPTNLSKKPLGYQLENLNQPSQSIHHQAEDSGCQFETPRSTMGEVGYPLQDYEYPFETPRQETGENWQDSEHQFVTARLDAREVCQQVHDSDNQFRTPRQETEGFQASLSASEDKRENFQEEFLAVNEGIEYRPMMQGSDNSGSNQNKEEPERKSLSPGKQTRTATQLKWHKKMEALGHALRTDKSFTEDWSHQLDSVHHTAREWQEQVVKFEAQMDRAVSHREDYGVQSTRLSKMMDNHYAKRQKEELIEDLVKYVAAFGRPADLQRLEKYNEIHLNIPSPYPQLWHGYGRFENGWHMTDPYYDEDEDDDECERRRHSV